MVIIYLWKWIIIQGPRHCRGIHSDLLPCLPTAARLHRHTHTSQGKAIIKEQGIEQEKLNMYRVVINICTVASLCHWAVSGSLWSGECFYAFLGLGVRGCYAGRSWGGNQGLPAGATLVQYGWDRTAEHEDKAAARPACLSPHCATTSPVTFFWSHQTATLIGPAAAAQSNQNPLSHIGKYISPCPCSCVM